jgi:hypothetical protein
MRVQIVIFMYSVAPLTTAHHQIGWSSACLTFLVDLDRLTVRFASSFYFIWYLPFGVPVLNPTARIRQNVIGPMCKLLRGKQWPLTQHASILPDVASNLWTKRFPKQPPIASSLMTHNP